MPQTLEISLTDEQVRKLKAIQLGTAPDLALEQHIALAAEMFIAAFDCDPGEVPRERFLRDVRSVRRL